MEARRRSPLLIRLFFIVLFISALSACNGGDGDSAPGEDESRPAATSAELGDDAELATAAPDEVEPTEAGTDEGARMDTDAALDPEAVSVSVEPVAEEVARTLVPATGGGDAPPWGRVPEHVQLSIEGYALDDTFHEPAIRIYPVTAFSEMSGPADLVISQVQALVQEQPAELPAQLPLLPPFNAAQMFYAQPEFLEGDGGQGIRFVSQYSQARVPANNHELFYTYQGLTDDGRYYVSVILPVFAPFLPDQAEMPEDPESFDAGFEGYVADVVDQLNALDAGDFVPSLDALDAVVRSISVSPE